MSKTFVDHGFPPLSSFRLLVPPLQLFSAALLEIVKQGAVMYYGVLEEFITTVLETAPELLTDTERVQLVIGLRAKVVLELCRNDTSANLQDFQHHLSEMNSYITNQEKETSNPEAKASVTNFQKLVHTLVEDQCQKNIFFQIIFPSVFGPKYDSALQALMKKFLCNLQELLPVPSLEETSLWLTLTPTILKDCLDFIYQPQPLKTLVQHHKHHGHKVPQAFSSCGDDCIFSSLSIHLPKLDNNKGYIEVKSEPMSDSQDWQREIFLDRQLKEDKEESLKLLYPELVRNMEEPGQQCVDEVTEDQGASVEVILPSFDEQESSDEEHMDMKGYQHLKGSQRTSAKTLQCEGGEDLGCQSKRKEHKISSTSQSCSFEKTIVHPKQKSCGDNKAGTELSRMLQRNSELSHIWDGCDKVFNCQENFKNHQRVCVDVSKAEQDLQASSSSEHHCKTNVDETSCETSHEGSQDSKYFYPSQDEMCKSPGRVKQCSICREIISSSTDFMEHMKWHTEQKPFLCSQSGKDFETHQEGECRALNKHEKYCSFIRNKKWDQENTLVPSDLTTDVPKDSKTRKPLLVCKQCGMRFTYCRSFEKHQIKCSGEASHRKTKKNYLTISELDSFSAGNTDESHAEKSCKTEEETQSTVVFHCNENCGVQANSKCRASKQHVEDDSWSSGNTRNRENTISETSQTVTTEDPKASRPALTCQECGLHFTYRISFKEHQKKCKNAASQRKTNRSNLTVDKCDFTLSDSYNTDHVEESSETVVTSPSSKDFKSHEEIKIHKEDACRTSIQHLEDFSVSGEIKKDQDSASVSSETSQTATTAEAPAPSKAFKPPLTCQKCGLRFTYYKSFEKHQKKCSNAASQKKTKKNYLIISGCDLYFADDTDEKGSETMEITSPTAGDAGGPEHKARTFKCSMCEVNFSKIEILKRHYSELHDIRGTYPCTMCKRAFVTLYELVRHQQNKLLFLCPTCKKGFSNIGELKRHEKIHTASANITPMSCETCGRSFKFRVNLIRHQRRHRERPPSVCSYCGKEFSTKDGLKAHMVRHTDGYPCPVCGKKFYQKAYLTYHLKRHTGQEKYLCDICGKGWPTVSLLKVHMVKHTEGQPFQCDDCGATYKRKSGLMAHHRDKHLGLRPFVCEICSKGFRIKSQLKKHMSVHTGERPYSCPICSKRFTKSFNLKKHREKPCL